MQFVQRKITFKLSPNSTQADALMETLALHCRVYNTPLEGASWFVDPPRAKSSKPSKPVVSQEPAGALRTLETLPIAA